MQQHLDPQEIKQEFESDAPDISLDILSRKIDSIKVNEI